MNHITSTELFIIQTMVAQYGPFQSTIICILLGDIIIQNIMQSAIGQREENERP